MNYLLLQQINISIVMPDLIRHPGSLWTPAFAGVTNGGDLSYIIAGVIKAENCGCEKRLDRFFECVTEARNVTW
jgi:hypothetical protein